MTLYLHSFDLPSMLLGACAATVVLCLSAYFICLLAERSGTRSVRHRRDKEDRP